MHTPSLTPPFSPDTTAPESPEWTTFWASLGPEPLRELGRRTASLPRQSVDAGGIDAGYRVCADTPYPQRPWGLEVLPWLISATSWQCIAAGITQRMRLLEALMADIYGPQRCLQGGQISGLVGGLHGGVVSGVVPAALVYANPGYWRAAHGLLPAGATHLHIAAFDLVQDPSADGESVWRVLAQHLQAPMGLGYMQEHRACMTGLFPEGLRALAVPDLAWAYRALATSFRRACEVNGTNAANAASATQDDTALALLSPGPFNETYFDDAYLARQLGVALVHSGDLTVRDECLYRAGEAGPVRVRGLLRRMDDEFLDPLELRADSHLGIPGLVQAVRAGNLLLANAPGAACLESPDWFALLPDLAQALLGEPLTMPSVVASAESLVKFPSIKTWGGHGHGHYPISADASPPEIVLRPAVLRVFAFSDGPQSWRLVPGGMAQGSAGADVWVVSGVVSDLPRQGAV